MSKYSQDEFVPKNPQKLVLIFKRLADKLQTRMKNGEITKEEFYLMWKEAGKILSND